MKINIKNKKLFKDLFKKHEHQSHFDKRAYKTSAFP